MGLVALVPHFADDNSLAVVLATDPQHFPVIIYPCSDNACAQDAHLVACKLGVTENFKDGFLLGGGTKFGGIMLNGEELKLEKPHPPDSEHWLELTGGKVARTSDITGALPETRSEAQAFDWIPRLANVSSTHCKVTRGLLEPKNTSVVMGLLKLERISGSVAVHSVSRENGRVPVINFEVGAFGGPTSVLRQAVADVVALDILMDSDSVKLSTIRFNSQASGHESVTLKPGKPKNGRVEILLGNLTKAELTPPKPKYLDHFIMYYKLSDLGFTPKAIIDREKWFSSKEINPKSLPDVIRAVMLEQSHHPLSGYSRALCTTAVLEPPN